MLRKRSFSSNERNSSKEKENQNTLTNECTLIEDIVHFNVIVYISRREEKEKKVITIVRGFFKSTIECILYSFPSHIYI